MAPQTKSEINLASSSTSVAKDNMSFQTQRRGSLKTVSSLANPWNEPLPMNLIPPQRRSLPERLEEYDDTNHSKRRQERTSYHTAQSPASVFPSVKRTGWFAFITASFRPSIHQHLLSFESLTKIRCFGEILIRLSDDSVNKAQWLKCRGYESPLHFLLQYRPPLTIVNAVIYELKQLGQKYPEAICDSKGRNSLHIACATVPSNSVAVIARLLKGQTIRSTNNPAAVTDKQRMLPLHHACNGKVTKSDQESRVLIIRFLAECFPQGVLYLNHRGMTPSDLARKNGNHPEILMILYQTLVDQRKAASAINTKSIDMFSNNTLNNDMVQKYTKSEHRRDGLAAFVQSANDQLTNARKSRLSYNIEKDDISDFASMDTFGYIEDESVESADDAKSSSDTVKVANPLPGKSQADMAGSDDVSELDSVYTFGFIADDRSAIEEAVSLALPKEAEKHLPAKTHQQQSVEQDEESIGHMIANEELITETSENDDSVMEYLHGPFKTDENWGHERTILDDTMEYSSSETGNDEIGTGSNIESTNSLSKYFDSKKLQPMLPEVDTSSVSLNSFVVDTSSMVVTPSTSESDGTPIMSPTAKKFVQFNDCVQIFKILTLPFSDDDDDDNCKLKDTMDHTDPTESETSTTSSSNPLDDSDRGSSSAMTISEVAATTPSLKMLRYRHCNGVQQLPGHKTNKIPKAENRHGSSIDTTSLFFL